MKFQRAGGWCEPVRMTDAQSHSGAYHAKLSSVIRLVSLSTKDYLIYRDFDILNSRLSGIIALFELSILSKNQGGTAIYSPLELMASGAFLYSKIIKRCEVTYFVCDCQVLF